MRRDSVSPIEQQYVLCNCEKKL